MGYFSNGTMGEMYELRYCEKCIHYGTPEDGKGCPVWFLNMMWNYSQFNDQQQAMALGLFIPRAKDPEWNKQCAMFFEDKSQDKRQDNELDK